MWPFFLIATVIVVTGGGIVAWRAGVLRPNLHIADVQPRTRMTPTHGRGGERDAPRPRETFTARGSWVLSALPDCVRQRWERRGPAALTPIPAAAQLLGRGTIIRAGACRLHVGPGDVEVRRGRDRFGVPPPARLYAYSGGLLLEHDDGARRELRAYRFAP